MDSMMMTKLRVDDLHREAEAYRRTHAREVKISSTRPARVRLAGRALAAAAQWVLRH